MDNKIVMGLDRLDDDSVVVNFDEVDTNDDVVGQCGYVHVRQEDNNFVVVVFNGDGDVLSETNVPIVFVSV